LSALLLFPVVLSLVALGAHFLRGGNLVLVAAVFVLLALVVVRRPWAARTVQVALVVAGLEWVRTIFRLASERAKMGEPATRMVVILATVALVAVLSAALFQTARLRRFYRQDR